ncbi:hypothetical protein [Agromyces sp. NPDC058064]|uniref:hypothetical protein n=1 Tax=Agromyces sp. NPDC058064 TaxID=3346322 RepID=UPI0036DC1F92
MNPRPSAPDVGECVDAEGRPLPAERQLHNRLAARPVLDAENTHTSSIEVILAEVAMTGTEAGPEPEQVRPVGHRRRDSILATIACVIGAVSAIVVAYGIWFAVGGA